MKQETLNPTIHIRVQPSMKECIEEESASKHISSSALIREVLAEYFKNKRRKKKR